MKITMKLNFNKNLSQFDKNGNKNLYNWMKFIGFNNSKNLEKLNMVGQA